MNNTTLEKLRAPFTEDELEWRVQSSGVGGKGTWARILAYVSARAIQNRLDEVFGFDGWKVEYTPYGNQCENVLCRISFWSEEKQEWIYKEDGSSASNVDPFKGAISGALKRTASSGLGIGRYLYELEAPYAEISNDKPSDMKGWNYGKTKNGAAFYWKVPAATLSKLRGNNNSNYNQRPKENANTSSNTSSSTKAQASAVRSLVAEKGIKKSQMKEIMKSVIGCVKESAELLTVDEANKVIQFLTNYNENKTA